MKATGNIEHPLLEAAMQYCLQSEASYERLLYRQLQGILPAHINQSLQQLFEETWII